MKTPNTPPATQPFPQLLTLKQLSELLNIGMRTVARMQSVGKIPQPLHIGGSVRWNASTIQEWIESGCPDCRKQFGGVR